MTKISIITCTYNSEKYLFKALDSLLQQNIEGDLYEHIIVDGNSTDGTIEIINKYIHNNKDKNIRLVKSIPKGVYNAFNIGIKEAKGEFLCFLNSDDFLGKDSLKYYMSEIQKYKGKYDVFYGDVGFIYDDKIINTNLGKKYFIRLFLAKLGFHVLLLCPSIFINKEIFKKIGYFDETKKVASDFGMWLNFFKKGVKMKYIPKIFGNFRVHPESISSGLHKDLGIIEMKEIRKEILGIRGCILNKVSNLIYKITGNYL